LITELNVGGAEVMLAHVAGRSNRAEFRTTVISLSDVGAIGARIRQHNVPVYALGMRPDRVNALAMWRLVRLLRRLQPDILQTWLYHADVAGTIAAKVAGVPHTVWNVRCADLNPAEHPRSLMWLLRVLPALSALPAAVICNSTAGRREHERLGYRPRRWSMIPNGFDTDAFSPAPDARRLMRRELGIADDVPLVGMLARLHPMKDHPTFVKAAAEVARRRDDVRFVIAGRGVDGNDRLLNLARSLSISDRVRFLPERQDSAAFLAALDVAVSSSSSEAFPNVVGEAMACGVPCVVTDVGESRMLVGDTGVVVPPRDPTALADGILRVLALDPASRTDLGRRARRWIQAEFSLQPVVDQYLALYAELVGHQSTTSASHVCAE
jgi:glycosyltransferase involved in cell wall biosynthesis